MRFRVASLCHCQIPAAALSSPDIIGTTHISPPQCVKPRRRAIPLRVLSYLHFSLNRSLSLVISRAQIHLPCRRHRRRRERLPRFRSPLPPPPARLTTSRRLYIASGKILRRIRKPPPRPPLPPIERRIDS